ncbi:G-protein coupled receptor 157 isoform X2 [Conger conger]|nr:G-protein coupled receptor 157 isoform X2 [Conger conger]
MLLTGKIWEFAAYVTLPVLYILIKRHIHGAHAALSEYRPILASSIQAQSRSSMADRKMTFIPIIFISLRIWSSLRFLLMLVDSPALQHPLLVTLHGIGNTFQGAANCIMFVLCTKPVRSRLLNTVCCCSCAENSSTDMSVQEPPSEDAPVRHENTVPRRWGEDC